MYVFNMNIDYYIKNKNSYYNKNILLKNKNIIRKFNSIYIPPVYKNAKYYIIKNKLEELNDVYATAINSLGRTQYKYTKNHNIKRNIDKYQKLLHINKKIPKIYKKIDKDLIIESTIDNQKNRNIALLLKIMNKCNFRIGNKIYENKYGSIGMTTLKKEHINFKDNKIYIDFIGKKKVENKCILEDKNMEKILKNLSKSKNTYLFSYLDNSNISKNINKNLIIKDINVNDVNDYLKEFDITNKDLRMWNANYLFIYFLKNNIQQEDKISKKKNIKLALEKTALFMHNTPSVCKSSYICKEIYNNLFENENYFDLLKNKNIDIMKFINLQNKT